MMNLSCETELLEPEKIAETEETPVEIEKVCKLTSEIVVDSQNWHQTYNRNLFYNNKNLLVSEVVVRKEGQVDSINYKYDTKDNLIEKSEYFFDKKVSVITNKYDANNRMYSSIKYLTQVDQLLYSNSYTYHANGKVKTENLESYSYDFFTKAVDKINKIKITYDQDGKLLEQSTEGQVSKYEYENQKLIKLTQYVNGAVYRTTENLYSSTGLIEKVFIKDKTGIIYELINTYDILDNLILQESFYSNKTPNNRVSYTFEGAKMKTSKTEVFYKENWIIQSDVIYQNTYPIAVIQYKNTGEVQSTTTNTFDSSDQLIKRRVDFSNGQFFELNSIYSCF